MTERTMYPVDADGDIPCCGCGEWTEGLALEVGGSERGIGLLCPECVLEAAAMILRAENRLEAARLEEFRERLDTIRRGVSELNASISRSVVAAQRVNGGGG